MQILVCWYRPKIRGPDLWLLHVDTGAGHTGGNKGYQLRAFAALVPRREHRFTLIEEYALGRFGKAEETDGAIDAFARAYGLVAYRVALRALSDYARLGKLCGRVLMVYTYNE